MDDSKSCDLMEIAQTPEQEGINDDVCKISSNVSPQCEIQCSARNETESEELFSVKKKLKISEENEINNETTSSKIDTYIDNSELELSERIQLPRSNVNLVLENSESDLVPSVKIKDNEMMETISQISPSFSTLISITTPASSLDTTTDLSQQVPVVPTEKSLIHDNSDTHENKDILTEETENDVSNLDESNSNITETEDISNEQPKQLFNFDQVPFQITGSWAEFENFNNNFLKGCKWAPDGSCILTNNEDNYLRIFNLPDVFYNQEANWANITEMKSVVKVREGELIYDFCWYPLMNSIDPNTCSFVCTSRNNAVHMFDGYTGELRCSYRAYNHVDEIDSAYSLNFSNDGQKLYCGFNKIIRIFDVNIPGRLYEERKTKIMGQYGIISCIAMNPAASNIYAAGSYLRSVGLYAESDGSLICLLEGQQGGITHIMFSLDGTKIFTGGRKDPEILCWDLRNPGEVLFSMQRDVQTNQRMYFDLDSSGRYLVSGNNDGKVSIWNVDNLATATDDEQLILPTTSYFAHDDCVNGISLHSNLPLLVTASGQRKFPEPAESDDSDTESVFTNKHIISDNSLRLWWCGQQSQEHI